MHYLAMTTGTVLAALLAAHEPALAQTIETAPVQVNGAGNVYVADGYVEAVRQTVIAAQVPGRVTALAVKAGDAMKSGQILARVDNRAAEQQAAASDAQVAAARAQMDAAEKEYQRSQRLFQKQYISQAAMDQAEAQYKSLHAQARAMLAQAGVASTQTSFHALPAPYNGIVATVTTELGDMAVPGKPLMTVYDPGALRVVATLPERYVPALKAGLPVRLEFPGAPDALRWQTAQSVTVLPTQDPTSHTAQVRLNLPANIKLAPGTFARAYLPVSEDGSGTLTIPLRAVVKRTELQGVYVAGATGKFQLRQVRLGKITGDRVAVLAGLQPGERVALDPVAASRQ
ncbi:MAG TPA: efflux RND transporter periplasmic adaptor subunit [Burkholderiales bacterium]|nr:efflux RND transporter periplasmic adaptor subunit [Burkholderiales bacterium]